MLILSALSVFTIIYFEYITQYFQINNEPWFFHCTASMFLQILFHL